MTHDLSIDFETRSDIDLRKRGAYIYFASPHTRPLMASYIVDDGPTRRWRPGAPCPADIVAHVTAGGTVSAHNCSFERLLWQHILTPRYGWPVLRLEQCRCTAATAAAMSLPRDLKGLGAALNLPVQKDREGGRLIRKFSVPRRPRAGEPPGLYWNEPEDHPEDFERFHDYCDRDVETEVAADRRMVPLSDEEQALYLIDQRINDRGLRVDRASAYAAMRLADAAKADLDREMRVVTGGYVPACSNVAKLVGWVGEQDVPMLSAAKAELDDILHLEDLPPQVSRALSLRQEAAKTSVAKLGAFLDRAGDDGRLRGAFLFNAAGTGRWSSIGAQVHNLPRPRRIYEDAGLDTAGLFADFRTEQPGVLKMHYGDELGRPLHLIADAIRGFVWAAPGHDLLAADYSGIEGAVAAWFAGETWKVEALHAIAADPQLPDMYRRTAARIMNMSVDDIHKKHPLRQSVGKVSELALGYQGGVAAFHSFARVYGVKLDPLFGPVWEQADAERRDRAARRYERCLARGDSRTDVLSREAWLACDLIKVGWRVENPAIAASWPALEKAAREAVGNPGHVVEVLKCAYVVKHGFLWCRLPSGRCLAYGAPRLREQVWAIRRLDDGAWPEDAEIMDRADAERLEAKGEVRIQGSTSPKVTALGVNSVSKRWERFALYGGLAFENLVQGIARDLLAHGIRQAEAAGYPVIGHVHDEIITEVPRGFGDVSVFEAAVCDLPAWADGLPLTANGWRGKRYRK